MVIMTQTLQPNVQGMFHKNLIMKKYLLAYVVSRQSLGMVVVCSYNKIIFESYYLYRQSLSFLPIYTIPGVDTWTVSWAR